MWGSLLIKKNLVLGVANKKDLYLGTEGVENINNNVCWGNPRFR